MKKKIVMEPQIIFKSNTIKERIVNFSAGKRSTFSSMTGESPSKTDLDRESSPVTSIKEDRLCQNFDQSGLSNVFIENDYLMQTIPQYSIPTEQSLYTPAPPISRTLSISSPITATISGDHATTIDKEGGGEEEIYMTAARPEKQKSGRNKKTDLRQTFMDEHLSEI